VCRSRPPARQRQHDLQSAPRPRMPVPGSAVHPDLPNDPSPLDERAPCRVAVVDVAGDHAHAHLRLMPGADRSDPPQGGLVQTVEEALRPAGVLLKGAAVEEAIVESQDRHSIEGGRNHPWPLLASIAARTILLRIMSTSLVQTKRVGASLYV